MKIQSFTFGPFQENTYLLINDKNQGLLIDPGCFTSGEEKTLVDFVESNSIEIQAILHTHCHIDHILGTAFAQKTFSNAPTYAHENEMVWYENAEISGGRYGIPVSKPEPVDHFIQVEHDLHIANIPLEVRFVPGHSPGHVIFIHHPSKTIIGGDVLFKGSIGRTDLPYCNHEELLNGIQKEVYTLPEDYTVYSGHGPRTMVGEEKRSNPFVRA